NQLKSVGYGISFFPQLFWFCVCRQVSFFVRCFLDIYSLALKTMSIASINFRVSARLGRLAQSEI
ncbi:TPA: hypothetical protein ACGUO9_004471, partial [Vibrio vulnificus]